MKEANAKQKNLTFSTWVKVILCVWCFIFIIGFAKAAIAKEQTKTHQVISGLVSQQQTLSSDEKAQKLAAAEKQTITKVMTRAEHQAFKQKSFSDGMSKAKSGSQISIQPKSLFQDFTVYDAYSALFDDYDGDEFFQTFSVIFDVDVITYAGIDEADVYAEIYLSRNGGPWEFLHTTDSFRIYGQSTEDEFEVMTNLATGYPTDYYDVLIDVYEVGYSDIVATYSSDDTNNLYALPLESDNYDQIEYYEEIEVHGGSNSVLFLILIGIALVARNIKSIRAFVN